MSRELIKKFKEQLKTLMPTTKYCKICFKEIKTDDMCRFLDNNICLCAKCQNEFEPKFIRFKIDGYKAVAIYEYTPFIKNLIYTYKGCSDFELNETFLNPFFKEIRLRYKGYEIIPAPSYIEDDKKRGFNHVVEAFKKLDLKQLNIVKKTAHHKQAEKSAEERKKIGKYLVLSDSPSLRKKRVLIIDDIYTTGATIKSIISLVEKLNPKEIRVLVLAKTRQNNQENTNTNYF